MEIKEESLDLESISLDYEKEHHPELENIEGGGWESPENNEQKEEEMNNLKDLLEMANGESDEESSHSNVLDKAIVIDDSSKNTETANCHLDINFGDELEDQEKEENKKNDLVSNSIIIEVEKSAPTVPNNVEYIKDGYRKAENAHGRAVPLTPIKNEEFFKGEETHTQLKPNPFLARSPNPEMQGIINEYGIEAKRGIFCCMIDSHPTNGNKMIGLKCGGCTVI